MKILVFSDSHGAENKIVGAIKDNPTADVIIYLGDGEKDFEYALAECDIYPYGSIRKDVYQVRGNCDVFSSESATLFTSFDGYRFLLTHGHAYNVKYGTDKLADAAAQNSCCAALFGHTHEQHYSRSGNVYLFNPGSTRSGSYGLITIDKSKLNFEWKSI